MKLSQEAKIGLLALVTMTMLYFGFNYLKGSDIFSRTNKFYVIYDNIDGLTTSNSVLLNGLAVGRVERIEILQDRGNQLLVMLDVKKDIIVPVGTKAILADAGVLGGKQIRLELGTGQPLEKGDTLVSAKEKGLTAQAQEKLPPVLNKVDSLMASLNRVVGSFDQTATVLNRTLASTELATGTLNQTLAENRQNLNALMGNLNRLSANLVETERQLKPILAKANTFTDSLNALQLRQTLNNANRTVGTLQTMLADINRGQGTLGKLKSDEKLYANVTATTASLDRLLTDLRENPRRYVHFSLFGRKEKANGKTEAISPLPTVTPAADTVKPVQ
ncbi:MlaD family protein [Tellurirhabdus rosea]|uniref:MlaD family protein n=1 Tax=Tellurirhabdus rosea TaxID=2674997 RepID=UPI002252FE84|nr:MlaD family protein [Tellurirhabdus rosea]